MSPRRAQATLAACGAALTASVFGWIALGDPRLRIHLFLGWYGAAFAAYLLALHVMPAAGGRAVRIALALSVAWRLALVAAPPLLSDDVFRSVWEGRIQVHGGNPYRWEDRPESPRWAQLRDDVWRGINHKEYPAIYPPLWQLAVRATVAVHDSVAAVKLLLVGCELLSWWALAHALRTRGLPCRRLLVWAWSPLALVEIAGSGHNDAFAMLGLSVALAAPAGGTVATALAAGALGKMLPALVALAWLRRFRLRDALLPALLAAAVFAPFADAGAWLHHSLGKYSRYWHFNETGFAALRVVTGDHLHAARMAATLVAAAALALGLRRTDPVRAAFGVIALWLFLAPSVLPWYALWLLPLLVLRDAPPALLFTGTVALSYLVYPAWLSGERWQVGWGIRALEYGPCLLVALWGRGNKASTGER